MLARSILVALSLAPAPSWAISFVGSVSGAANNQGNVTLDLSVLSMQENDLVVVCGTLADDDATDYDVTVSTAGYTEFADLYSQDTKEANVGGFYKFMGATPDTQVVVPNGITGTDGSTAAVAQVFRGVDLMTPMDVAATTATGINTSNPDPPSIDHNGTAGIWVAYCAGTAEGFGAGGAPVLAAPTGYTTNQVSIGVSDTNSAFAGMGYNSSPSDPENPGVVTSSNTDTTDDAWAAITMALRPAASSCSSTPVITSVDGDNSFLADDTSIPIVGTGFCDEPGVTGSVTIYESRADATRTCAINSWTDTLIDADCSGLIGAGITGGLLYGPIDITVTNDAPE